MKTTSNVIISKRIEILIFVFSPRCLIKRINKKEKEKGGEQDKEKKPHLISTKSTSSSVRTIRRFISLRSIEVEKERETENNNHPFSTERQVAVVHKQTRERER